MRVLSVRCVFFFSLDASSFLIGSLVLMFLPTWLDSKKNERTGALPSLSRCSLSFPGLVTPSFPWCYTFSFPARVPSLSFSFFHDPHPLRPCIIIFALIVCFHISVLRMVFIVVPFLGSFSMSLHVQLPRQVVNLIAQYPSFQPLELTLFPPHKGQKHIDRSWQRDPTRCPSYVLCVCAPRVS